MTPIMVVAPGRGSYSRDLMGGLQNVTSPALDVFDGLREDRGLPTATALDAAERFNLKQHVAGEHASILTAACSMVDFEALDLKKVEVVAVTGNSMGFYTALGISGALSLGDSADVIDTMGGYQQDNVVGGQLLYPMVDSDWRLDEETRTHVTRLLSSIDGLYWSIVLGGQAVVGGTDQALKEFQDAVPAVQLGANTYPLRLPLHSGFHTPLLEDTSLLALMELEHLDFRAPSIPLVDGRGAIWRPVYSDPAALRHYTLGTQVTEPFDFTQSIRVGLREFGPERIVLLGPGGRLGSVVAQILIEEGWQGIKHKDAFLDRQKNDPIVVSMNWPDQRKWVT